MLRRPPKKRTVSTRCSAIDDAATAVETAQATLHAAQQLLDSGRLGPFD